MAGRRRKSRGREGGQYIALPYAMVRSEAWRHLSGSAIKVWCELRSRYFVRGDGSDNNGELRLSLDEAKKLLGMGKATVARAFEDLEAAGFIVKVKQGQWYGRKATEWRVTDCRYKGAPPTRDWQKPANENQKSVPRRSMFHSDGTIRKPNA